jgi:hypothetical protein
MPRADSMAHTRLARVIFPRFLTRARWMSNLLLKISGFLFLDALLASTGPTGRTLSSMLTSRRRSYLHPLAGAIGATAR